MGTRPVRSLQFFFRKNLLLFNSLTSGGCMVIGDLAQQEFEYRSKFLTHRYDMGRLCRMFIVGLGLGPLHHYYYKYLDILVPKVNLKTTIFKIVCDQGIAAPLTIVSFFYGMAILENKTLVESTEELKEKFGLVYLGDWIYWPPVQFINFYYLPTQYRVFYINVATMVYNAFLSYMKHFY